jgi:hypothetical protein
MALTAVILTLMDNGFTALKSPVEPEKKPAPGAGFSRREKCFNHNAGGASVTVAREVDGDVSAVFQFVMRGAGERFLQKNQWGNRRLSHGINWGK